MPTRHELTHKQKIQFCQEVARGHAPFAAVCRAFRIARPTGYKWWRRYQAGVVRADGFDPEMNPKLEEFAWHHDTGILPTKPTTPLHKGKAKAGVKYAQNNAVKGRGFGSLSAQSLFHSEWEHIVADTRIHGTCPARRPPREDQGREEDRRGDGVVAASDSGNFGRFHASSGRCLFASTT